ncbi:MAG: beta-mannanase [Proteobacteria bacterium]|nr:MAG: beta-mannanase [Pseudomonadota bacterium]
MQKFTSYALLVTLLGVLGACQKYEPMPVNFEKKQTKPSQNTDDLDPNSPKGKPDDTDPEDPVVPKDEIKDNPTPSPDPKKEEPVKPDPKIPDEPTKPAFSLTVEAEDARLTGLTVSQAVQNFSGKGYVTGFDADSDSLDLDFEVPRAGAYQIRIGYAAGLGDKETDIVINNEAGPKIKLTDSKVFATTSLGRLLLKQGKNTITVKKGWGYYDIDYFKIEETSISFDTKSIPNVIVTPNATPAALKLWTYLKSEFGKHMISGQVNVQGDEGDYIKRETGKTPAMGGFDLLHYTSVSYNQGQGNGEVERAIDWYKNRNGIVTFVWHWFSPSGQKGEKFFYTSDTDFDVERAVTAGTRENREVIADMKAIGDQLERLKNAGVPILWRPLHEAEGKWFWWGAKGPEACKKLYAMLFNYLANERKLTNLIWVWNSVDPAWYPGNATVDIVSTDIYHNKATDDPNVTQFEALRELTKGQKIVSLAENDAIPDPSKMKALGAYWSWFNTWGGEFILSEKYNSKAKLKALYNSEYVITLDELPVLNK